MQALIDAITALSLIHWVILGLVWVVSYMVAHFAFARWIFRRQWRLYRNLKRPIIILEPIDEDGHKIPSGDLKIIVNTLRRSGLFNVRLMDYREYNPSMKHCIVVAGYIEGMAGLTDILRKIGGNQVPLIVYTYGIFLSSENEDKKKIENYPYSVCANFPLTVLSHIFSNVTGFPYENR
jgi:hypothetical protein